MGDEVVDAEAGATGVVGDDCRHPGRGGHPVEYDDRDPRCGDDRQLRARLHGDHDDAVHLPVDERPQVGRLPTDVAERVPDQQDVPALEGHVLDRARELGEERVPVVRDEQAHRPGPLTAQRPRGRVGPVAQLVDRCLDPVAGDRSHRARTTVDHVADDCR